MENISSNGYFITILLVTGLLLLRIDVKSYKNADLKKERKVALILGWTNISLSIILTVSTWVYQTWIW
ncbi:CLC_0170 family protein [Peribacillus asahii]|uniref:CLC_0170 family protein n=1 Tax=Peribacillus asahii TaxID=228899 RepID=UPI0038130B7F